jgi:D-inositol-3-phosphate glycosyltransferase
MTDGIAQRTEIRFQRSDISDQRQSSDRRPPTADLCPSALHVALLTGGSDRPYVLGLVEALTEANLFVDVIGSDELRLNELLSNPQVNFLNLRRDQSSSASFTKKVARVIAYYWRLLCYAATAKPGIFHILWNNKFEHFDRTLLCLYYKALGKRLVLTAHNVNMGKRDGTDTWLNRLSLKVQYHLVDRIFVHTDRMKTQLVNDFRVAKMKVVVIPFGLNNTSPTTSLSASEAKARLGVRTGSKVILCFGQIAPYKGLEYLVRAFSDLAKKDDRYRLVIAGKPKWNETYWRQIRQLIDDTGIGHLTIQKIGHVPDEETEIYFKAADVLVLPYVEIFQSGVISLAYSFGLPVLASDVGSLKDSIIDGRTGYVFRSKDCADLAKKIEHYFQSEIFLKLETARSEIKAHATKQYSWQNVAAITTDVYSTLLH